MAQKPSRDSTGPGAVSSPAVTSVASLSWMMPALRSAMIPRNSPIPAAMASFSPCGIASMIQRRTGSTLRIRNSTPETNTVPSATSHEWPMPSTTP